MTNQFQSGAVQTAYVADPDIAISGLEADDGPNDKVTRIAIGAITFGTYVSISGESCYTPALSTDITANMGGIAVVDPQKATGVGYQDGEPVTILRSGRIWVTTENAVSEKDSPYIRYVAGTGGTAGTLPGGLSHSSDAAKNVQVTNGIYVVKGNTASPFLAMLQLDYPGPAA